MNIYILNIILQSVEKKSLFILTRPFCADNTWIDDVTEKKNWGVDDTIHFVETIENAQIVFIPLSINSYFLENKVNELAALNVLCQQQKITAYGFIAGDFGIAFPDFSNIIYFRASGFKSQLPKQNKGFQVALSDHFQLLYQTEDITPNSKKELPTIGFCGHATVSIFKRLKEMLIFGRENLKRLLKNPFRKDWEFYFASAYERARLLKLLEKSSLVKTNFIYRNSYRAGAKTAEDLEKTTKEYFDNLYISDYVLCVRGAGNFSVRFYETLMFGRIPIFVNTDCMLPFEDKINWKNHVVWIEWKDREKIAALVADFHKQISNEDFIKMQLNNRKLWKETLSINGMLQILANDI